MRDGIDAVQGETGSLQPHGLETAVHGPHDEVRSVSRYAVRSGALDRDRQPIVDDPRL